MVLAKPDFLTTWRAERVLPKRIFAFQSIRLPVLNCFSVFSMASSCSGRNTMGVKPVPAPMPDRLGWHFFTASIAFWTVARSTSNHSLLVEFFSFFLGMPEFSSTRCTSWSRKAFSTCCPSLPLTSRTANSVCNSWAEIPAVFVYCLIRLSAA